MLDYNSQEQEKQAAMEEAPAWAKLLYREVKSQSAQYAQFKMQFNGFKAVVNQRLTKYEKSAEFINSKYEDIEMECDTLQRNMDAVDMRNDDLKIEMKDIGTCLDDLEQYSRRNCLVLYGAEEKHVEIVDDVVLKVLNTKMEACISIQDIERAQTGQATFRKLIQRKGQEEQTHNNQICKLSQTPRSIQTKKEAER